MFSENLLVFDGKKNRWETRTPKGLGWKPSFMTTTNIKGERTDEFDAFVTRTIEDPAAPVIKKLAVGEALSDAERILAAWFMAITMARNPHFMHETFTAYLGKLTERESSEWAHIAELWCEAIGRKFTSTTVSDLLREPGVAATIYWSISLRDRLLNWRWFSLRTEESRPFILSDNPTYRQHPDNDTYFISFPMSTTHAIYVTNAQGKARSGDTTDEDVRQFNLQTMLFAREFVVASCTSFPGSDQLHKWRKKWFESPTSANG